MAKNNKTKNADKAQQKTFCDSACELFNKMRPSFEHAVEQMEGSLSEFTIEEQEWIISWAREVACEPYVAGLLVPKDEHEDDILSVTTSLASLIREYEDEKKWNIII